MTDFQLPNGNTLRIDGDVTLEFDKNGVVVWPLKYRDMYFVKDKVKYVTPRTAKKSKVVQEYLDAMKKRRGA